MNLNFRLKCPDLFLFNILHVPFILPAASVTVLPSKAPRARALVWVSQDTPFSTAYSSSLNISSIPKFLCNV